MQDYRQDAKEWKGISDVFQEKGIHAFDIGKAQNKDTTPEELLRVFDELFHFWRYSQEKIVFDEYRSKKSKIRACLQSSLQSKFDDFEAKFRRHCIGNGPVEPNLIEILKKEFGDMLIENNQYKFSYDENDKRYLSEIQIKRENHNYNLAKEYLLSIYVLSKCRYFIGV